MTATKFITFGIGCLLLLPFIWSFILMVLPPAKPSDEAKALWEQEKAKMLQEAGDQNDPDGIAMGWSGMISYRGVTMHERLAGVWLLAPRTWVGVLGLVASAAVLFCLFVSSFYSVIDDSFGVEIRYPNPEANAGGIQPLSEKDNAGWTNPTLENDRKSSK
ncbi:MAG: hypothetical protein ACKVY0_21170 [Prosthecobacter sp.]|uniref:hypothetical protein n=1 Tax=Prosthecobacter sp. TaxID=1965333 RepID=UPI0039014581